MSKTKRKILDRTNYSGNPLLDGIAPEMMDTKIGQSNKLQFTPANIARQVHKRAGPSIYLRGMNLEYRFELATQQLNDEFGTGLCLCIMLVNDKYDWFREKSDLFRGRWGRDYRYGHVYSQ